MSLKNVVQQQLVSTFEQYRSFRRCPVFYIFESKAFLSISLSLCKLRMKTSFVALLGVTYGYTEVDQNPYGKLVMEEAWKQEITYDWENLDHAAAFANWKKEFGKVYDDIEVLIY